MKTSINIILPLAIAAASIALAFVLVADRPTPAFGMSPSATVIGSATTTAATSITTSARIMATTTNPTGNPGTTSFTRVYAVICNPNTNPVWLNLDNDKAANLTSGNVTTVIAAAAGYDACFEITDRNLYQGSVTASSTAETATTITVKQYVQ